MTDSSTTVFDASEQTRLLNPTNTTTPAYNTLTQSEDERSERVVNVSLDNEPTLPLDELTNYIQHLLDFRPQQSTPSPQNLPSDQGQEMHDHTTKGLHQKHKKREIIAGALRFATDQWRENQGNTKQGIESPTVGSSSSDQLPTSQQQQEQEHLLPSPMAELQYDSAIWDVAKNASVCAILGLIDERRRIKNSTLVYTDNDDSLQQLALCTLEYGLKQTTTNDVTRQEMLFKPWIGDKSGKIHTH
jgi:hypothetical protein